MHACVKVRESICVCVCVRERGSEEDGRQINCSWLCQYVYRHLLVHFLFILDHLSLFEGVIIIKVILIDETVLVF